MSDQQAPQEDKPEIADNPEAGTGATEQQTQAETDWQRQYQNLQPEYTRATQEASELRQRDALYQQMLTADDPDARREAAEALGYEFPEEDNAAGQQQFVDEEARRLAQRAAQWVDSFEEQAQQYSADQLAIDHINQQFPAVEKQLGRELTGEEAQVIGDLAMANRDENGVPQVDGAAELVLGVLKAAQDRRPKPRAPHFSATGAEATQVPDLDNRNERQAWMAAQLMANEQ